MKNYFRILVCLFCMTGFSSCHSNSEEYEDILREGSWYVYDIDYSYRLYNEFQTLELVDFFHFLLEDGNLLFLPGDELIFSKDRINVKCPNHDGFRYDYYYYGDYIRVGKNGDYMGVRPEGSMEYMSLSFDERALEDLLADLLPTDEYYAYLLDAVENNLLDFHITYHLQRPVPDMAQIMTGIFVGTMFDGNQQLMNEEAVVNLSWGGNQMNLTMDDKVVLEDESGRGPQFYVQIMGLQIEKGVTPGSYLFSGEQLFTDNQYGPVDVRIVNGRYNAVGTITLELEIVWNENLYLLDLQKGVRVRDFESLQVKSAEKVITLQPKKR